MGYGLVGAGAAASGFVDGYQRGRRFIREEEAADDEKVMRGLKIEGMRQSNKKGELDLEVAGMSLDSARKNRKIDELQAALLAEEVPDSNQSASASTPPRAAIANPAASAAPAAASAAPTPMAMPEGEATQVAPGPAAPAGGISDPAAAVSQPGAPAQKSSVYGNLQRMSALNAKLFDLEFQRPGANRGALLKSALDSMKMFRKAETEQTLELGGRVLAGENPDAVMNEGRARGMNIPEGTKIEIVDVPLPGSRDKTRKDFVVVTPNGTRVDGRVLRFNVMDAKDALNADTEMGKAFGQAAHYEAMEQIQRDAQANAAARDERNHREQMSRIAQQIDLQRQTFGLQRDKFAFDKHVADLQKASAQFERLVGYTPLTERDRLAYEKEGNTKGLEAAESRTASRGAQVSYLGAAYAMNIDPLTYKPSATPAEVHQAAQILARTAPEDRKRDDLGRMFVVVGNNKVFMPSLPGQDSPPPANAPAPQTRIEQRNAGINPPPAASGGRPLPAPVEAAGVALDQARTDLKALESRAPGLKAGPDAASNFRRELAAAQSRVAQAEQNYSSVLQSSGAMPRGPGGR